MSDKVYKEHCPMELDEVGGHYSRHVMALTKEDLYYKSDIAIQLGARDMLLDLALQDLYVEQDTDDISFDTFKQNWLDQVGERQ